MANIVQSKGYTSSYRGANNPSAFYLVNTSDFGAAGGAAPSVAYNAGGGSLAMGNAFIKVTWITAEGESGPSAEGTVVVSAATGAATVTKPTTPTNGQPVLGWRVYSAGTTNVEALNTAAGSTTQAQQTFATAQGNINGFPISTTAVQVKIYGTGASVPAVDFSGIQPALPSVSANTTADYSFIVPNSGSQWKTYKPVQFARPDSTPETAGISISANLDCISPLYPGVNTAVTAGSGSYFVMNGYLFVATTGGTTATAFIGFSAFNTAKYGTTTDGTVVWTCLGKAVLVRAHFINNTGSAAIPVAQEYDLFEL